MHPCQGSPGDLSNALAKLLYEGFRWFLIYNKIRETIKKWANSFFLLQFRGPALRSNDDSQELSSLQVSKDIDHNIIMCISLRTAQSQCFISFTISVKLVAGCSAVFLIELQLMCRCGHKKAIGASDCISAMVIISFCIIYPYSKLFYKCVFCKLSFVDTILSLQLCIA